MMFSKSHTKYIQSLQHKKFRDEFGVFTAEGPKVVLELLDSREFPCKEIFALPRWLENNAQLLERHSIGQVIEVKDFELEKISALQQPNNVLAVFAKKEQDTTPLLDKKITLMLDTIQDPGNMGTIIRTADWFGIGNIICSADCADMYNNKVVQSTMGSLARVNIIYTQLDNFIRQHDIPLFAAAMDGEDVRTLGKLPEGIIVIGNEGKGISEAIFSLATQKINIPRLGEAESLNAAIAAGIILSHVC